METTEFDRFRYILTKEYESILLRTLHASSQSSVRLLVFNDQKKLDPRGPAQRLSQELAELTEACHGEHQNDGKVSVKDNVVHELCDCVFLLMALDVALGDSLPSKVDWANELAIGMEYPSSNEEAHSLIGHLHSISSDDPELVRALICTTLRYLGTVAVNFELSPFHIGRETQSVHRWSRQDKAMNKRLADLTYVINDQPVPKEKLGWLAGSFQYFIDKVFPHLGKYFGA